MHAITENNQSGFEQRSLQEQRSIYSRGFYARNRWRWHFRDDCRYRRRRLREILQLLNFDREDRRIYDVGFGTGDLLLDFPRSCFLMGAELSQDTITGICSDPRLAGYRGHWFGVVEDGNTPPFPDGPLADLIITSHVLEHVPDDSAFIANLAKCLKPGGLMIHFVPVEPAGFDPKHIRTYGERSLSKLVSSSGLEVIFAESNYHANCGPLRWLDHPARHSWPILKFLEGVRHFLLTPIPYRLVRSFEALLSRIGGLPNQAVVVASKPVSISPGNGQLGIDEVAVTNLK